MRKMRSLTIEMVYKSPNSNPSNKISLRLYSLYKKYSDLEKLDLIYSEIDKIIVFA